MTDIRLNKLKWRSIRRSMLEVDLFLSKFIDSGGLDRFDSAELDIYSTLLELPDSDLLALLQGNTIHPNVDYQHLLLKLKT